jgi:WD40 repeat protein
VRCFDARSGVVKRSLKSHGLAVNCIQVSRHAHALLMECIVLVAQVVKDRLFSGSVDGTVKVWDIGGLKGDIIQDFKAGVLDLGRRGKDQGSTDNRSDVDSGIDEREFHDRRAQNMV